MLRNLSKPEGGDHRGKNHKPRNPGETKSEMADKWAWWLHNPCRLGGPNVQERGTK